MSWYSLYLSHHSAVGKQLPISVNVIHCVFEGNLLHTVRLFKQTACNSSNLVHFCIELWTGVEWPNLNGIQLTYFNIIGQQCHASEEDPKGQYQTLDIHLVMNVLNCWSRSRNNFNVSISQCLVVWRVWVVLSVLMYHLLKYSRNIPQSPDLFSIIRPHSPPVSRPTILHVLSFLSLSTQDLEEKTERTLSEIWNVRIWLQTIATGPETVFRPKW